MTQFLFGRGTLFRPHSEASESIKLAMSRNGSRPAQELAKNEDVWLPRCRRWRSIDLKASEFGPTNGSVRHIT